MEYYCYTLKTEAVRHSGTTAPVNRIIWRHIADDRDLKSLPFFSWNHTKHKYTLREEYRKFSTLNHVVPTVTNVLRKVNKAFIE